MKRLARRCGRVALLLLAAAAPCPPEPGLTAAQSRFPQPVAAGALIGRLVLAPLESQPVLARVQSLRRGPDGATEAVLLRGGALERFDPSWAPWWRWGAHPVTVPLHTLTLLGDDLVLVDLPPSALPDRPAPDPAGLALAPDTVVCLGLSKPSH